MLNDTCHLVLPISSSKHSTSMDVITIEAGLRPLKSSTVRPGCVNSNSICYVIVIMATLAFLGAITFICRDYIRVLLFWIEHQNTWLVTVIMIALFTVVSFPIVIGYLFLVIASGYLFGIVEGAAMVVLSANLGIAIAHMVLGSLSSSLPVGALLQSDTARAILRVISGPQAFKVVLFTRLTPIPFGLQNTIFAVSIAYCMCYVCQIDCSIDGYFIFAYR